MTVLEYGTSFTDFVFNELSLTKSKLKTILKKHFLKSHSFFGSSTWTILFCEFQMYLVILIFRTFGNYEEKIERWHLFLLPCIFLGLALQSRVSRRSNETFFLSFACKYIYPSSMSSFLLQILERFWYLLYFC